MKVDPSQLIAHSSDPSIVVDGEQRILAANLAFESLLGFDHGAAIGLKCAGVIDAVSVDGGALCCHDCEAISRFRRCRAYAVKTCFAHRRDGSQVRVAISTISLPNDGNDSEPVAIIFLRDAVEAGAVAESGSVVAINTLGRFAVSLGGCGLAIEQWPRKQAVQLLKFLTFHGGRPVHRERLEEFLWKDAEPEASWSRLKVIVHFLRQKFREAGIRQEVIGTCDSAYLLRLDCVEIDALSMERLARGGRDHQQSGRIADAIHAYREAKNLYRGDYMEADLYADWSAEERERLLDLYLEVLGSLAELLFASGDFASAAQECHAALVREPCRERMHQLLIRSLIALDRPEQALRQFEHCQEVLRTELGVSPSPETRAYLAPALRPFGRASASAQ